MLARVSGSSLLLGPKREQIILPEVPREVLEKDEVVFFVVLDAFQFVDSRFAPRRSIASWPS